ncbi:MAG: phosphorylase [Pleurocapsa sp. SU_5_0]|nr:phosphorylase [Pleurocapsa sp. SU_5_0]NJR45473.1 phosphorylase [Hyellaceae cyanobacterium CSU_1_1]
MLINTIVVPQGAEYQVVCRGLSKAQVDSIQVIAIPIGVRQISQVLANYSQQIDGCANILMMGLCGSLSNSYTVQDSVLIKSCQDLNHNLIDLNAELTAKIQQKLSIDLVNALTSDRAITQAQEKLILAQQYSATIVEMEGYNYVKELKNQGIFVAMLRVVSDDLRGDIPDLNQAIDSQGNLKTLPLAIALITQPLAAIRLIKGSLAGLKALEEITAKLFTV